MKRIHTEIGPDLTSVYYFENVAEAMEFIAAYVFICGSRYTIRRMNGVWTVIETERGDLFTRMCCGETLADLEAVYREFISRRSCEKTRM